MIPFHLTGSETVTFHDTRTGADKVRDTIEKSESHFKPQPGASRSR